MTFCKKNAKSQNNKLSNVNRIGTNKSMPRHIKIKSLKAVHTKEVTKAARDK